MKKLIVFINFAFLTLGIVSNSNAVVIGNDIINRSSIDGASNINFIDPTLVFTSNGTIESWDIYAGRISSEFALQVFRSTGAANQYTLVGENYFSAAPSGLGAQTITIPTVDQIQVLAGDIIGWWFGNGRGVIDYSGSIDAVQWKYEGTHINVGNTVTFNGQQGREYSISANYTPVPEPSSLALLFLGLAGIGVRARKPG